MFDEQVSTPSREEWADVIRFYTKDIENARRYRIREEDLVRGATDQINLGGNEIIRVIMTLSEDESRENITDEEILRDIKTAQDGVKSILSVNARGSKDGYNTFLKHSYLRSMYDSGMDVSFFCDKDNFSAYSLRKMKKYFTDKVVSVKKEFNVGAYPLVKIGMDGLTVIEMLEKRSNSMIGYNQASDLITTALNGGLKPGQVMLLSAGSSVGKTGYMISSLSKAASKKFYKDGKWYDNIAGDTEGAVYISTEIDEDEFKEQLYSCIADVNRSDWEYMTDESLKRLKQAEKIAKESKISFVHCPEVNKNNILEIVENAKIQGINYVFLDYVESNSAMLEEYAISSKGVGAREDSALLDFMKFLKDKIAVELQMMVMCGSQLSGGQKYILANERDGSRLANCKSLQNKVDIAVIMSCIPDEEYKIVRDWGRHKVAKNPPNRVISIYKLRGGRYNHKNIYGYFDLGSLRWHDCYTGVAVAGKSGKDLTFEQEFIPETIVTKLDNGYKVAELKGEEELNYLEATKKDDGSDLIPPEEVKYFREIFKRSRNKKDELSKKPKYTESSQMEETEIREKTEVIREELKREEDLVTMGFGENDELIY